MSSIQILFRRRPGIPMASAIRSKLNRALDQLGRADSELHILLTDDSEIRRINREYRGKDEATDVLSFPDGDRLPDGRVFLGQIVVSLERARVQARELGHDEGREILELLLHGLLHLLGWDHETDEGEMDELEVRLRRDCLR